MAEKDDNPEAGRSRLLKLLRGDDWKLSERAEQEGQRALHWLHNRKPTRWEMVEYVISVLKSDATLRCASQGDPPGSTGIAWQVTDPRNIFIKLRIEGGFGQECSEEYAFIQSIHESAHPK